MTNRSGSSRPSGRFLLRVDPGLHATLKQAASDHGLSLNDYCARKLAVPIDPADLTGDGPGIVRRAMNLHGTALEGVVVFGSWARGEAGHGSDIDLLVVLDHHVPLTRGLYRAWDEQPASWDGRPVEVHLAHVPSADAAPTGLWAEVALDGLIMYERGRRISVRLVSVRREIAAGRYVRRVAQGQPYWTKVA